MGKRYKTVLIDADNTLLDFDAAERQALRRTMEARGLEFNDQRLAEYVRINRALWDAAHRGEIDQGYIAGERFARFGRSLGWEGDAGAWDRDYLRALGDCPDTLPGAVELLRSLKPYCVIALATNGLRDVRRRRLAGNPIGSYLDGVFISQEMGVGKPRADFFRRAMDALGAERESTVMIGDDLLSDIQGAVNAGIDSVWYAPRGGESPLPTWQVASLADIPALVLGEN